MTSVALEARDRWAMSVEARALVVLTGALTVFGLSFLYSAALSWPSYDRQLVLRESSGAAFPRAWLLSRSPPKWMRKTAAPGLPVMLPDHRALVVSIHHIGAPVRGSRRSSSRADAAIRAGVGRRRVDGHDGGEGRQMRRLTKRCCRS
jgi:hypothetical protein